MKLDRGLREESKQHERPERILYVFSKMKWSKLLVQWTRLQ